MENNFNDTVKLQSDSELKEIIINSHLYMGSLIAAAKDELLKRGVDLSVEEKQSIAEAKEIRK